MRVLIVRRRQTFENRGRPGTEATGIAHAYAAGRLSGRMAHPSTWQRPKQDSLFMYNYITCRVVQKPKSCTIELYSLVAESGRKNVEGNVCRPEERIAASYYIF